MLRTGNKYHIINQLYFDQKENSVIPMNLFVFSGLICSFSSGPVSDSTYANTEAQRSGDFFRSPPSQQYGTGCLLS